MPTLPFRYVIGLEIHAELNTVTKMFCRCANAPFGAEPNEHTCPICMALPGTLPVPNREAIRKTVMVGKALGSHINELSKWDRKHYFYPDNPKGYQISQYDDMPLCAGGSLSLLGADGQPVSTIRFNRIHLEEDAGKLMHGSGGYTKVDLNRAGVPLMEMVTEPDLTSPEQARAFLQEVRLLVRTLGVSDADMEKGQMRCDVNVSLEFEHEGATVNTPITEIKNVNSTKAVERSLQLEGQRLFDEWMAGGPVRTRTTKLTAGYDEESGAVRINRHKEAANEYRYFPEPDIPPVEVYKTDDLNPDTMALPELPNERRLRYLGLGLSMADAEIFVNDAERAGRFEAYLEAGVPAKGVATWLINTPESQGLPAEAFMELLALITEGAVPAAGAKSKIVEIIAAVGASKRSVRDVARELGLLQEHDDGAVEAAIAAVIAEQPQAVAQWRAGEEKVIGFLTGQVMKKAAGKAQAAKVQEALKLALSKAA